jgi:REP element-mobilizing transposase RayT
MAATVWNLRSRRSFRVIEQVLRGGADRFEVRVVQFSIQGNHIHLLVEAPDRVELGRAIKGLSVRLARGLNRMMKRSGRVLGDRYHAHVLRTPSEVRRAISYIRDNARQHAAARGEAYSAGYIDPYCSAARGRDHDVALPAPQTWLCRQGGRPRVGPS